MPEISVIVAVYNASKYLDRCVNSILCQTFVDIEILLIDDGSNDSSAEMCDMYAAKDSRVRVFHKQNGGVASARQVGLNYSKGRFIIHVDSDDWQEPSMLEKLYDVAISYDADIVMCDFYREYIGFRNYITQRPSYDIISDMLEGKIMGVLWNKLIKASYCKTVSFNPRMTYVEDLLFCLQIMLKANNIAYLPCALYHYDNYSNTNSLVKNYTSKSFDSEIILLKSLSLEQLYTQRRKKAFYYRYALAIYLALTNGVLESQKELFIHRKELNNLLKTNLKLHQKIYLIFSMAGLSKVLYCIYHLFHVRK